MIAPQTCSDSGERGFRWMVCALIVIAGVAAYVNSLDGDWVWDDASSVLLHQHVQQPSQFLQLFREDQHAFGRGAGNFYRPLVSASFMADFLLAYDPERDRRPDAPYPDVEPFLFHVSNVAWHLAAALLAFGLLTRLRAPRIVRLSTPLLFVLHPLNTEAVAYISGRADMMSATFMFAAMLLALSSARGGRLVVSYVVSLLFFCIALLCKESSLVYPALLAVVLLMRATPQPDPAIRKWIPNREWLLLSASVLLAAGYAWLRATKLKFGDEPATAAAATLSTRVVDAGQSLALYVLKLFMPTGLHMEWTFEKVPSWLAVAGGLLFTLMLATVAIGLLKRHSGVASGIAWFLVAWLPISGLFPLNAPFAEHWMYVPMVGFWWAVTAMIAGIVRRRPAAKRAAALSVSVLCLLFLGLTVRRNEAWDSNVAIYTATLKENPFSERVRYNLAVTYQDLLQNLPAARRHFLILLDQYQAQKKVKSLTGDTSYLLDAEVDVHLSLGEINFAMGKYNEAVGHFGRLMALAPEGEQRGIRAAAGFGLGKCLLALGDYIGAQQLLLQAAQLNPEYQREASELLLGAPLNT